MSDDKFYCEHCERQVNPRLILEDGVPARTLCPGCGLMISDFTGSEENLPIVVMTTVIILLIFAVSAWM